MKAIILDDRDNLQVGEVADPEPGPGEVSIAVAYAGVQWGDVLVRQGHFPTPRPYVPGFEAAGHIVGVGAGIDPARLGEPVTALTSGGAFAERVTVPASLALALDGIDVRTGAAFGWVTPTAYDLINTIGAVDAGDRVLIHAAAGGVGSRAVQFARAAGAADITGVVGTPQQIEYASGIGCTRVIDKDQYPGELSDSHFDVILDPIGGPTRAANVERLAPHGRLVVYGNIASWDSYEASANDLLMKGQSLLTYNSNLLSQTAPDRLAASARAALEVVRTGTVAIQVTAEYPLSEAAKAVDDLAAGATFGKTILRVAA